MAGAEREDAMVQGTSVCLGGEEGSIRDEGGCDDEGVDIDDDGDDRAGQGDGFRRLVRPRE